MSPDMSQHGFPLMIFFLYRNVNHHRLHHHTAQILQITTGKVSDITETQILPVLLVSVILLSASSWGFDQKLGLPSDGFIFCVICLRCKYMSWRSIRLRLGEVNIFSIFTSPLLTLICLIYIKLLTELIFVHPKCVYSSTPMSFMEKITK